MPSPSSSESCVPVCLSVCQVDQPVTKWSWVGRVSACGQFAVVNKKHLKNVGPIRYCEPPLHCQLPGVASRTPAIAIAQAAACDVHDNDDDNDNA